MQSYNLIYEDLYVVFLVGATSLIHILTKFSKIIELKKRQKFNF